jgi:hypothetical protein
VISKAAFIQYFDAICGFGRYYSFEGMYHTAMDWSMMASGGLSVKLTNGLVLACFSSYEQDLSFVVEFVSIP